MGNKYFAVPWNDLKLQPAGLTSSGTQKADHYVLDVNKETLKNAPGFNKDRWPDLADPNWTKDIDKFYGDHRRAARQPGMTR